MRIRGEYYYPVLCGFWCRPPSSSCSIPPFVGRTLLFTPVQEDEEGKGEEEEEERERLMARGLYSCTYI